jgi:hypothetical protein
MKGSLIMAQQQIAQGNKSLRVIVAAHKEYSFPPDPVYCPVQVGAALSDRDLGYVRDDTGDNISDRNPTYSELTALYWAWKNTSFDYYGLAHYRRYFRSENGGPAHGDEMLDWLSSTDVVVARPRHYVLDTVSQQYAHAHHSHDLSSARAAVSHLHPEYVDSFDRTMRARSLPLYSMFLMSRDSMNGYCSWLFPILDRLYAEIPWREYGSQQARVIGLLGERLLPVWLRGNPQLVRATRPIFRTERDPTLPRAVRFVLRKATGGRVSRFRSYG